ncbi:MAG: hypothetical protein HY867_13595 [Chloroflexi bacterium]|nr:hypothetical protein [Chloroflexota bacterium]
MYVPSKEEKAFVESLLMNAKNEAMPGEVRAILRSKATTEKNLLFQLGIVRLYADAKPGERFSADYEKIGRRYWGQVKRNLFEVLCGKSRKYMKERNQLKQKGRGIIIMLVPIIMSQLGLPSSAAGVAVVLALIIAKIGINAFCDTCHESDPPSLPNPGSTAEKKRAEIKAREARHKGAPRRK